MVAQSWSSLLFEESSGFVYFALLVQESFDCGFGVQRKDGVLKLVDKVKETRKIFVLFGA